MSSKLQMKTIFKHGKDYKEENDINLGVNMANKCIKINVKPYIRRNGLFTTKVKGFTKKICNSKKGPSSQRIVAKKKYGFWYNL
ncbi:hypothetical protein J4463_01815 [Candidatus Pacearchaeota archaeon]|nr:hypothetical protein [Candidatus Pacearchaeota archaeon]